MTQDQNEDELEILENDNGLRNLSNRQKQQVASKTLFYCCKCDCNMVGQFGKCEHCEHCGYKPRSQYRKTKFKN